MTGERLDTASVFERIFAIYRAQAAVLLPAALILYIVPSALSLSRSISGQAFALAASFIAAVWYQGLVAQAVRDIQDGRRDMGLRDLFRSVADVLAPLLWTAILVGLGVFVGILAFIVPGLILLTIWSVAAPVVVIERPSPTQALGRSRELVRGHGWSVFGVLVVTLLIVFIANTVFGALARAASGSAAAFAVASLLSGVLTAPFFALASAVLYLELRRLRGEPPPPAT
jgi:hypothetical protein